jgi:hypothetical protein
LLRVYKIFGFVFIGIFAVVIFNYAIFNVLLNFKKQGFRTELFKTPLVLSNIKTIKILKEDLFKDKNGIEWHENNLEISVQGKFYEICKIVEFGEERIIYAIADEKENELVNSFFMNNQKESFFLIDLLGELLFEMVDSINFEFNFDLVFSDNLIFPHFNSKFNFADYYSKIIKPPRLTFA